MRRYAGSTGLWTRYPDHYPDALRGGPDPVGERLGPVHLDRLPAPDAPCTVLLAHPAADRWTPPPSRRFLDRIAAPTVYVGPPDAGHLPAEPAGADALRTALHAFLARVLRGGTAHPGVT
ncbi:hypothetical protein [Pseudonocardia abyssalis]|uniref:Alpha/beta hydrolase n=1 Tax=Pseudonocardia abyssalis TaxID=2792008 RepID=A0ABS6UQW2_9PSEU|nr:hypothetical protein [Pseudonocardia abyssalis]MBW0134647.1 hypothetical protein [Pseudonocardia abyssalis]